MCYGEDPCEYEPELHDDQLRHEGTPTCRDGDLRHGAWLTEQIPAHLAQTLSRHVVLTYENQDRRVPANPSCCRVKVSRCCIDQRHQPNNFASRSSFRSHFFLNSAKNCNLTPNDDPLNGDKFCARGSVSCWCWHGGRPRSSTPQRFAHDACVSNTF